MLGITPRSDHSTHSHKKVGQPDDHHSLHIHHITPAPSIAMDILPAPLHEHRLNEEKMRLQRAQKAAAAAATPNNPKLPEVKRPQNPTQAFLQRPPLLRPNSTGFFGSIHQGFLRAAANTPSPGQQFPKSAPVSGTSTPSGATTPGKEVNPAKLTAEMEKYIAHQKRREEPDYVYICSSPPSSATPLTPYSAACQAGESFFTKFSRQRVPPTRRLLHDDGMCIRIKGVLAMVHGG